MLVHNYKLFRMLENGSIMNIFTRYTDIINNLKSFGRNLY